jgi:hypothetical protein
MENNLKSKFGFALFFIIVFTLLIGGYFFTNSIIKEGKKKVDTKKEGKEINYKIDEDKDYIYFINEETISEGAELYYKDVVINLNTQDVLNESLQKENNIYKSNVKHISEMNVLKNIITYNFDDIYALTFRDYEKLEFGKYISLVIKDYNYSCFDGVTFNKSKAYVFNTENGKLLSSEDLLKMYNTNIDTIKERIKEDLNKKQSVVDGKQLIKIDETIEDINTTGLYINAYGKLMLSYIAKTSQIDYNYNEITEVG